MHRFVRIVAGLAISIGTGAAFADADGPDFYVDSNGLAEQESQLPPSPVP